MTSFQRRVVKEDKSSFLPFAAARVYKIVRKIPRGKVLTYKKIAKLAGSPRAWRAVGNVLNQSASWRTKIPCHRVIRSDGRIGGYKYGAKRKIALLKKEGIIIDPFGKLRINTEPRRSINPNGKITSRFNK